MKIVLMAPIAVVGIPLADFQNTNKTTSAAGSTVSETITMLSAAQGVYIYPELSTLCAEYSFQEPRAGSSSFSSAVNR
jgi:hypothetical protein